MMARLGRGIRLPGIASTQRASKLEAEGKAEFLFPHSGCPLKHPHILDAQQNPGKERGQTHKGQGPTGQAISQLLWSDWPSLFPRPQILPEGKEGRLLGR